MSLSNAERQRRWREKQKQKDATKYLEKEAKRKRKSYVPTSRLKPAELKQRRAEILKRVKKHNDKKKQKDTYNNTPNSPSTSSDVMIVKLPGIVQKNAKKATGLRKTYRRSLRQAYRNNQELRHKNQNLLRANKRLQKRIERIRKQQTRNEFKSSDTEKESELLLTPRSKTKKEMKTLGLNKLPLNTKVRRKLIQVRRKFLLTNTVLNELKDNLKGKKKTLNTAMIWKGLVKKYRCGSKLAKSIGVCRQKVAKLCVRRKMSNQNINLRNKVVAFLEREDDSSVLPGKKDTKKVQESLKQKHVLSDYMHNLYFKFTLENPRLKISRSLFYSFRPQNILLANFSSRKTCLCSRHQNMALKMRAISSIGVHCPKNPDDFIRKNQTHKDQRSGGRHSELQTLEESSRRKQISSPRSRNRITERRFCKVIKQGPDRIP